MYLDEIPSVYPSIKTIDKLLLEEESEILEFKSSMLHPHKPTDKINALENQLSKTSSLKKEELIKKLQEAKNEQSRLILEEIIIAITSFLNSRGGTFLIGIEDNKKIIGIDYDYKYLSKNNWDGWLLYLKDKLKKYIKVEVVRQLNILILLMEKPLSEWMFLLALDMYLLKLKIMKISILGILILRTY